MAHDGLRGCRLLVVEDEYFIADDLARGLEKAGAIVLGPVGAPDTALDLIDEVPRIDGAILDINLAGDMVYPVAERLLDRRVPFVFATGYERVAIPERFAAITRCEKPVSADTVGRALERAIAR